VDQSDSFIANGKSNAVGIIMQLIRLLRAPFLRQRKILMQAPEVEDSPLFSCKEKVVKLELHKWILCCPAKVVRRLSL
jgi:hypothetical protein